MNYDLIIIKLIKPHLKQVIAHHIAADPAISLQKAISLLDNLPLVYIRDLSFKELEEATLQLNKLGAVCRAIESKNPLDRTEREGWHSNDSVPEESKTNDLAGRSGGAYTMKINRASDDAYNTGSGKKARDGRKTKPSAGVLIAGMFLLLSAACIAVIFRGGKKPADDASSIPSKRSDGHGIPEKGSEDENPGDNAVSAERGVRRNGHEITDASKSISSDAFADSAASTCGDFECAITFYRIAISFNQNNLRAWQGLVAACRGAEKWTDAEDAEKRMKEIFGEKVFTVEEIVKPFGSLTRCQRDDNGVCRIEYRSLSLGRAALERETYFVTRALAAQRECRMISLYASTGKGKGMLVRIATDGFPPRVSDYLERASLSFTE